jgi:hypothetical protein
MTQAIRVEYILVGQILDPDQRRSQVILSKYSARAFPLLMTLPAMLAAQSVQDHLVPLKNRAEEP